jgi:hypothetical protein
MTFIRHTANQKIGKRNDVNVSGGKIIKWPASTREPKLATSTYDRES